ncbi:5-amino-6-(D-ribitylamino)uracil--L-tyrosine 4-hydroxyphenyl transferase CofH [Archaeoglobus veneficus]|uniref:5-amino-6-(D-ribitylamino)uracil--L-tyrosine 4-hydroxyphenyl transferase n=1 Tax=Archaeoglobus veneficus (strain DSM 11195 / SNP6) TaxID=693661 RepID=F2KQ07_ARCVS|nr:5-amino-6-(D-ribitylamino)uracil--L-tyrosine 4-hydroxyphenyl transferase CofH [Archaeoglobus veneficus]AEA47610.1 FO synthase subunit 2 [Archaeoglobus veneficus SNP6]
MQELDLIKNPFETFKLADELRKEAAGEEVTYVVNRNINFTDICVNSCRFCSFRNRRNFLLSLDEIRRKVEEAVDYGCTEVCMQGGLHPNADLDFYISILDTVRDVSKSIHIHAFSPMEVLHAARMSGLHYEDVLKEMKRAGLNSMPGTAAEILDDSIRAKICPEKLSANQWVEIVKSAHRLGIPTTATMMYGHIETWEQRIRHIKLIREIQEETGGFTEFIPLPFMWRNNSLGRVAKGSSGFEDLLVIAVARILLYPAIKNIQASWVKLGVKLAQAALFVGANDLGGTLMEENISKAAGSTSGEFLSVEELEAVIERAGRIPRQRDTLYRKL